MVSLQLPNNLRVRVAWLIAALACLVASSIGVYSVYGYQKAQNTRRLLVSAQNALHVADFGAAIESFGLYLERNPSDLEVLNTFATLLSDRLPNDPKLVRRAAVALRQLNRAKPHDTRTIERLVRVYMDLGEFGLAEESAKSWLALSSSDPNATLALARAAHANQNQEFVVQLLSDAVTRNPAEARFYPPLIELLDRVHRHPESALQWVQRGLENAPASSEVQMAAFLYFQNHRQYEPALLHLNQAIELAPDNPEILITAAQFHTNRGQLDDARPLLDRAAQLNPNAAGLLEARRNLALHSGDRALMIQVADELVRIGKNDRNDPLLAQATQLYLRGEAMAQADECLADLLGRSSESLPKGTLEALRGARSLAAGDPFTAIASLETAVRHLPSNLWVLEQLARAFLQTGTVNEAAAVYRRLALLAPHAAAPRLALSRLELQSFRFDQAREHLASISDATPIESQQASLLRIATDLQDSPGNKKAGLIAELESYGADDSIDSASFEILIHAFVDAGHPDRALEIYRRGNGEQSVRLRIARDVGRRLMDAGELESAQTWVTQLNNTASGSIEARLLQVEMLAVSGMYDEARKLIEQDAASPQQRGQLWEALAESLSDPALRIESLATAARLRPSDIVVHQKLAHLHANLADAQNAVDQIRALEGTDGILWKFEQALVWLRLDESPDAPSRAAELLRQCLDARPGWIAARSLLGFAQEQGGDLH